MQALLLHKKPMRAKAGNISEGGETALQVGPGPRDSDPPAGLHVHPDPGST